ncbi:class I SAM-dependent methyltransferase [Amycolatopsis sp. GM8]|uniref:class I SAM-dependent methyltransferase n=1 Tax=Amycolatopsis sp. GM8 TaxID=2896530 RepID=UPI001F1BFF52|nr:class I SAM-dependent methyltransferase [Amycolatopsis sp. GM8]
MSLSPDYYDKAYLTGATPWVIGQPQPAIIAAEGEGWFTGRVLDIGCGDGANAIMLARRGHDVLGIDVSPAAVRRAQDNALSAGVAVRFAVGDALQESDRGYGVDNVLDSALFHIFDAETRARYVAGLAISEGDVRSAFASSLWSGRSPGQLHDAPAWLASIERSA